MRKILIFSLQLFSVCFLISSFATLSYGQGYVTFRGEKERIAEEGRLKLGPFYLFPALNMSLGYDNNIYQQNMDAGPIADYAAKFSPRITAYFVSINSLIFSITEIPEYVYYFELENERGWNNTLSFDGKFLLLNRFVLSGGYGNSYRKQRSTSEFDIPTYVNTRLLSGRLFYETFRGTSIGISLSKSDSRYEDITEPGEDITYSTALNRKQTNGNVEFYYRVFSESQFFIRVGYTEYKFDNPEAQFRNSHSYEVRTGIQFPLLGRIRGALSIGYKRFIPEAEGMVGYSGPVGDTALEMRLRRFNFRLAYYRDIPFSVGSDIYFIENRYGAGISYYLTESIRLNYDFNYGTSDYPGEESMELPDDSSEAVIRARTYLTHRAGFTYRIYENLGIGFSVDVWQRLENLTDEETDRLLIGVYLTYDF
jgi:hypothetical protein